jgi:hypothetical protein
LLLLLEHHLQLSALVFLLVISPNRNEKGDRAWDSAAATDPFTTAAHPSRVDVDNSHNTMPSATNDSHGVLGVDAAGTFLDGLLERADSVKQTASIEPPLEKSDFDDLRRQLSDALGYELPAEEPIDTKKVQRFAVIETAVRDTFKTLIVSWPSVCAGPAFCEARGSPFPSPRQQHQSSLPSS